MISIREITDLDKLGEYREIWNKLNTEDSGGTVFTTYEWVESWYRYYKFSGTPLVLLIYNDNDPIGIVPLYVWNGTLGKIRIKRIDFAGHNLGLGNLIVTDFVDTAVPAVMDYLSAHTINWDVLILKGVFKSSAQFTGLQKWLSENKRTNEISPYDIPAIELKGTWDDYMNRIGKKNRYEVRKKIKKANETTAIKLHRYNSLGEQDLERYMDLLVRIGNNSWKDDSDSSIGSNAHVEGFYRQVAKQFNEKGKLDISILHIADTPVAYLFGLLFGNKYFQIDTAYLEEHKEFSPGTLLQMMLVQELYDNNHNIEAIVNYGDFAYKRRYFRESVEASLFYIFSNSLRAKLAYCAKFQIIPHLQKLHLLH